MDRDVLIIGAGGHAKVCIEVIRSEGSFEPVACIDPHAQHRSVFGIPVHRDDSEVERFRSKGVRHVFIAIGNNKVRERLASEMSERGYRLVNAVSPYAIVSPSVRLGRGVLVMPGAVINAEAFVGDLVIVNTNAVVEHDCQLGPACHVAPGSILAGGVTLGARAFIGAGAALIPGVSVGQDTIVGAGSVVISDVARDQTVVGAPARPVG